LALRVCHITTAHPAADHRILHKECASLAAAGYDVTLIGRHDRPETLLGVKILPLAQGSRHRAMRMTTRGIAAYRLARGLDADLYHFHDPEFLPYAVLLARRGTPVIYDAHEDVPRQILSKHWIRPALRPAVARVAGGIEGAAMKRLSAVIRADPPMVERYRALNDHVEVVANYPELGEITPAPWDAKPRAICCVGGLSEVRGTIEIVDAMEGVDGELILAGSPSPRELLSTLEARPGWKRVRYLGHIGRSAIGDVLDEARVGVMPLHPVPNHVASYPVKLFEYMAAGIPVVATDVEPWAAIIREHGIGLCVPVGDAAAFAEAFTHLLDNSLEAEAMGKRGRRAAEELYSWESETAKLLALYAELLPR
jgi:glycosyltransferase involved in cell wall biosynthesis